MESMVMMIRNMIARVSDDEARRSAADPRPRVRRAPLCEALEGRQLLSTAASSIATGTPTWRSGGGTTAADIAHAHSGGDHAFHGVDSANVAHAGESGSFPPGEMSTAFRAHLAASR
jgi:hypothetical protein